ncbi:MAG: hypothetical protein K1X55_15160 [Chitinophagales bacterium]|nr:hypothetical protein [Chitinophagales bacterium]
MSLKNRITYIETLTFSVITYLALIIKWGYEYGRGDQIELIPYARILQGAQSFNDDFFFSTLVKIVPNERWIMAQFLAIFNHLEMACLIGHILTTLLLIIAMEQVGKILIKNVLLTRISIFLCLVIFYYDYNLGGNDLYYNLLQASNISKMLGIWAIYFSLRSKWNIATFLLIIATFVHPIAGLTLSMAMFFALMLQMKKKVVSTKNGFFLLISYLLTAGIFVCTIQVAYGRANDGYGAAGDFYNTIFRFRNGHHYMPDMFHCKGWILLTCCYMLTGWRFYKNDVLRGWLMAFSIGLVVYFIGLYFQSSTIVAFQWFKLTIWLKYFGMLAFFGFIQTYIPTSVDHLLKKVQLPVYSIGILFGILFWIFAPQKWFPDGVHYDFGSQYLEDPAVRISLMAKECTAENAVFLVPYNFTELSCYGERSCYFSDKANPKYPKAAHEWEKRVSIFYGLHSKTDAENWNKANERYHAILPGKRKYMKDHGITHFITFGKVMGYREMVKCGNYYLYRVGE